MRAAVHLRSSGPATHSQSGPLHSIRSFTSRVCSSPSTSRCLFGQRPERPSAGGVAAAASGRAAASQQRRKTAKEDEAPRRCPCGSGLAFSECCQPIVEGAWARSPPELARARFTAMQLGNAQLLADTTHPESLKAIGTKQQLLRKWEAEMRMRGAHQPSMVDMAFAQDPQDEDCWYVMSALTYPEMVKKPAKDSSPMVYIVAETYVKEAGRWCFYEFPRSFPTLEPLMNFIDKYEGNDSVVQPWDGVYEYSWLAVPPAPLATPASPAPHSNDYNHDEQQAQQQQQGRGQGHRGWLVDGWTEPAAPGGWVYLDNAVDPDTGLTPAETAQVMARVMRSTDLRDPDPDFDTWYFRHGRFMGL